MASTDQSQQRVKSVLEYRWPFASISSLPTTLVVQLEQSVVRVFVSELDDLLPRYVACWLARKAGGRPGELMFYCCYFLSFSLSSSFFF